METNIEKPQVFTDDETNHILRVKKQLKEKNC